MGFTNGLSGEGRCFDDLLATLEDSGPIKASMHVQVHTNIYLLECFCQMPLYYFCFMLSEQALGFPFLKLECAFLFRNNGEDAHSNSEQSIEFNHFISTTTIKPPHSEKVLSFYSCIGGCLVAQNTVAEIWSNAW